MVDIEKIKEFLEKNKTLAYDMNEKISQKKEKMFEQVFAECGYSKEEVLELHKAGRLKIIQNDIYGFYTMHYDYFCEIDGERVFMIAVREYMNFGALSYDITWNYEIYKKKGE